MTIVTVERLQVAVLVIDVQHVVFMPPEQELVRLENLLLLADWMDLPTIATFEHPVDIKGTLPERLEKVFPAKGQRFTKHTYNCCSEPTILEALKKLPGKQIAVAGAETDVCVMQSTLGLLKLGYQVFLLEDCIYTSEPNPRPALHRLYQAGATPSTFKSFAYELTASVDHTPWLDTWIEKDKDYMKPFPKNFQEPEMLPAWIPKI